jgi:hypothetical protein
MPIAPPLRISAAFAGLTALGYGFFTLLLILDTKDGKVRTSQLQSCCSSPRRKG